MKTVTESQTCASIICEMRLGKKRISKKQEGKEGERGGAKRQKNSRELNQIECLPQVVLVTRNYKWSFTFQVKIHNHSIKPTMPFQWPIHPSLSSALLLFCPSLHLFSPWTKGFFKRCPPSHFPSPLVSEGLQ